MILAIIIFAVFNELNRRILTFVELCKYLSMQAIAINQQDIERTDEHGSRRKLGRVNTITLNIRPIEPIANAIHNKMSTIIAVAEFI
ncbi:unnamed protein product [Rotaria sordida]|uniref:Uncharacterized protein n=1 Tax=Rotaria sordida TaxID=392033 RepID=A0A820HRK3_9BILA|nr:unnamed protein product [Rotaria sordida]